MALAPSAPCLPPSPIVIPGRRSPCCSPARSWSCWTSSSSTSHCRRSPPGESSLEWVVAGYGLTFAAFLITAGRLGDGLGRRRVYAIGLGLFTVASLACGLAPSPTTLVIARIAQGVAGAIVMPQVLAIIGVTYRGPDYVRAVSIYGVVLGPPQRARSSQSASAPWP